MAEAFPVLGTSSDHPQAQLGQPTNLNAATAPGDALSTAGAQAPLFPPALMGRTRAQTFQLREGDSTTDMTTPPLNITEPRTPAALTTPTTTSGERLTRSSRVKKASATQATTVTVASGKDFNRLLELISGLDAKIQALGEMVERELSPAAKEQNLPPPPPLRQAFDSFAESYAKRIEAIENAVTQQAQGRARRPLAPPPPNSNDTTAPQPRAAQAENSPADRTSGSPAAQKGRNLPPRPGKGPAAKMQSGSPPPPTPDLQTPGKRSVLRGYGSSTPTTRHSGMDCSPKKEDAGGAASAPGAASDASQKSQNRTATLHVREGFHCEEGAVPSSGHPISS